MKSLFTKYFLFNTIFDFNGSFIKNNLDNKIYIL